MTRTRVLAALLAGLTLAGLGTAAAALGDDDPAAAAAPVTVVAQTRTSTPAPVPTTDARSGAAITADGAAARAVAHLGGGTATKVERETEHGRTVWEVDVRRDARVTEVHVDTATGTISRVEDDDRGHRGRHGDDSGRDRVDDKGGDR
jgi:uncharacterized membrane protein YkoI